MQNVKLLSSSVRLRLLVEGGNMTKQELAAELHSKKYNCAQSVACVFADEVKVPKEFIFKANEGFGMGAGTMEGICGALTGAIMIAGLKNSSANLESPDSKASTIKISKQLMTNFKSRVGALRCRDIKGIDTGKVLCSCNDCIKNGVQLVEEFVINNAADTAS